MGFYIIKIALTTALVVAVSEIAKRSTFFGALLASIPLISVLAVSWLYIDTKDTAKVSALATSIFWLVLPSLVFFVLLPLLLKQGINFYLSMFVSLTFTVMGYWLMALAINYYGVKH